MNKAITDGLALMPPPFKNGLDVWSRGDGTPGSATYDGIATAAFVPSDNDFAGCLEILKTDSTQRLRYMGETPLLPGCYLQVKVRIKAMSGNLPNVRIAAFAGGAGGGPVPYVQTSGPETALTSYGDVVEISAIIGTGARTGVDMSWGSSALFGHFGLDLTGPDGGVVRIDDIEITDVTSIFLRDLIDWVDVKDFGAIGDGTTDNTVAFEAADAAADGRGVLISEGVFLLSNNVTFESKVRFQGTVTMPTNKYLALQQNFDFDHYAAAFGSEELGFRKAFQALLKQSSHDSLDLCGRTIQLTGPVDMQAAVPDITTFSTRRVIRNGQFDAVSNTAWDTGQATSQATYSLSQPFQLSGVSNIANIEVGSLVSGNGVGREVYVTAKNVGAQTLTLSQQLHDAVGTQSYSFTRFRYMLDFSGFEKLTRFSIADVDIRADKLASCVMLSKGGLIWHFRDCFFNKPKDRGITSIGRACQGMLIDRCQFISSEQSTTALQRTSIGFNVNANDVKVRENRCIRMGHFAVMNGSGHIIMGNHWFHGDDNTNAPRPAGLFLTNPNPKTVITGNYSDNNYIEWNNEHDASPDFSSELSFGALSIVGNIFTALGAAPYFRFLVIKPYGSGHFINGLNVSGNTFKATNGAIERADKVDDSIAPLNLTRTRNVTWTGNSYHQVNQWTMSPVMLQFTRSSPETTWNCDFSDWMPFGGRARHVSAVTLVGAMRDAANSPQFLTPYTDPEEGSSGGEVKIIWSSAVKGKINVTAQVDNPY